MARRIIKTNRPTKQKFTPAFFYLIISLAVLILVVTFLSTSKVGKDSEASTYLSLVKTYQYKMQLKQKNNYEWADRNCFNEFADKGYFSDYFSGGYDQSKIFPAIGISSSACGSTASSFAPAFDPRGSLYDDWRLFTQCCVDKQYFYDLGKKYCTANNRIVIDGISGNGAAVYDVKGNKFNISSLSLTCESKCPAGEVAVDSFYNSDKSKLIGTTLVCNYNPGWFGNGKCCTRK